MKVLVLGAAGRLGSALVVACSEAGHEVTALARSRAKLETALGDKLQGVRVVEGDVTTDLAQALKGQDAVINSAGYIQQGEEFIALVAAVVRRVVAAAPSGPKRLWILGGAGTLDVPGRKGLRGIDVPGMPAMYRAHITNYELLQSEAGAIDWSFACPGPMVDAPAGMKGSAANVTLSVDQLPAPLPGWAALLPNALLIPALGALMKGPLLCTYQDVAAAIAANLGLGGPYKHKRVGFGNAPAAGSGGAAGSSG